MKKYFACFILSLVTFAPALAQDAVFSNSESESFELQPINQTAPKNELTPANNITMPTSKLSEQNFLNAINNLDNAQVEIREQLANYSALMAQSKSAYELKKEEYNSYKKQYKALQKKMRSVEKSKKMIQGNVNVQNTAN